MHGTIDVDQLYALVEAGAVFVLIDALPAQSYALRHLPGAVNLDPKDAVFDEKARQLIPDYSTPVVTYCSDDDCHASTRVAARLVELGYRDVCEFAAGLRGWRLAGHQWIRPSDDD